MNLFPAHNMNSTQSIIHPLNRGKQQLVIDETHTYFNKAKTLFNLKDDNLDIVFNLKGKAAGMYRVKRKLFHNKKEIRYNPYIFSKYFDDNFKTTIPHEVAHYISDLIYGLRNIKPHGKEWKEIMQSIWCRCLSDCEL